VEHPDQRRRADVDARVLGLEPGAEEVAGQHEARAAGEDPGPGERDAGRGERELHASRLWAIPRAAASLRVDVRSL
jgi:hypothetical protein